MTNGKYVQTQTYEKYLSLARGAQLQGHSGCSRCTHRCIPGAISAYIRGSCSFTTFTTTAYLVPIPAAHTMSITCTLYFHIRLRCFIGSERSAWQTCQPNKACVPALIELGRSLRQAVAGATVRALLYLHMLGKYTCEALFTSRGTKETNPERLITHNHLSRVVWTARAR